MVSDLELECSEEPGLKPKSETVTVWLKGIGEDR